jgi:hypothetical protein
MRLISNRMIVAIDGGPFSSLFIHSVLLHTHVHNPIEGQNGIKIN